LRGQPPHVVRRARTPPSTFLFLPIHLSNSLGAHNHVLQPRLWARQRFCEAATIGRNRQVLTVVSEELQGRGFACGAPPRPVCCYIGSAVRQCQPGILSFFIGSSQVDRDSQGHRRFPHVCSAGRAAADRREEGRKSERGVRWGAATPLPPHSHISLHKVVEVLTKWSRRLPRNPESRISGHT
jgi:hypothetical protein